MEMNLLPFQMWMITFLIELSPLVEGRLVNVNKFPTCNTFGLICESMCRKAGTGKLLVYTITRLSCSNVYSQDPTKTSRRTPTQRLTLRTENQGYIAGMRRHCRISERRLLLFFWITEMTEKNCQETPEIKDEQMRKRNPKENLATEKGYKRLQAGNDTIYVKRYNATKTWDEALEVCRRDGGTLAKTDTEEKLKPIQKEVFIPADQFKKFYMWIGMRDTGKNNVFKWIDGTAIVDKYWGYNEPNNVDPAVNGTADEDCVLLTYKTFVNLQWIDKNCEDQYPFLCEIILK